MAAQKNERRDAGEVVEEVGWESEVGRGKCAREATGGCMQEQHSEIIVRAKSSKKRTYGFTIFLF